MLSSDHTYPDVVTVLLSVSATKDTIRISSTVVGSAACGTPVE
jgi:hypothetical protein